MHTAGALRFCEGRNGSLWFFAGSLRSWRLVLFRQGFVFYRKVREALNVKYSNEQ